MIKHLFFFMLDLSKDLVPISFSETSAKLCKLTSDVSVLYVIALKFEVPQSKFAYTSS